MIDTLIASGTIRFITIGHSTLDKGKVHVSACGSGGKWYQGYGNTVEAALAAAFPDKQDEPEILDL